MMTASKNVFLVVDLLREVPPFAGQDFTWLDENLPKVFAPEKVTKAYTERKKEQGELFIQAMCLVAQLGFGIRDFRKALIPLVESLVGEDISRNPKGFSQKQICLRNNRAMSGHKQHFRHHVLLNPKQITAFLYRQFL